MKTTATILSITALLFCSISFGQELVPDQNPNYKESMNKYTVKADSLTASQSTTPQDTYKAYDWTEAKEENKQERQDRRYELRKQRIMNSGRCLRPFGNRNIYSTPFNSPYSFGQPYYGGQGGYNYWF